MLSRKTCSPNKCAISATEQRIQRQAELGPFHEPDEVVNRALDLLESQESWIARDRDVIRKTPKS